MAFREVRVYEIKEVLRLWLRGKGTRPIAALVGLDRKTVQRYIAAASEAGLAGRGEGALGDELMAKVCEHARPRRPDRHGASWSALEANHDQLNAWLVDRRLTAVRAAALARKGVAVPERTLQRYALPVLGVGRSARSATLRVADGEPASEALCGLPHKASLARGGVVPERRGRSAFTSSGRRRAT